MAKSKNTYGLEEFGISDKEFEHQFREATRRGKEELKFSPKAVGVSTEKGLVTVGLSTGWSFTFDPRTFKHFQKLTDKQIAEVEMINR